MKNALLFSAALIFGTTFPAQARVEITIGKQADPIPLQTGILWLNQDPAALSPETDTLDNSSEQETIPADLDERTMQICPGVDLVTDIDGNHYNTIKIGDHCWMRENLKTTHYRNGTPIAYPGNDNTAWQNNTTGAYAWYNNDVGYKDKYGALYNWHAVNSSNGLCPVGWHMPEWYDYGNLINYAGGWSSPTGNKLKSCRQVGSPLGGDCDTQEHPRWHSHHIHYGTDDFGFSALPAGSRITAGSYFYMGFDAYFWTASEWNDGGEYYHLEYLDGGIYAFSYENNYTEGFSVRCIWSGTLPSVTTSEITDITSYSAVGGGNVINTGTSMVTARGVVWSTDEYPTLENNLGFTFNLSGPGEFESQITGLLGNTTYYVRAYATNNTGTSYGNQVSFVTTSHLPCPGMPTITDVDGNIYSTVLIGNQCWMRENLRTTKYNDGTPIDNPLSETEWHDNTSGAYVWYDNNIGWKDSYGALYNWYAAVNAKGLCPEGWDVPTHDEWTALTNYIGGTDSPAGNHIKSCRQVNSPLGGECNTTEHPRWFQNANHYGIDQYGFNGLPGGTRSLSGFGNLEFRGYWWSSNEIGSTGLVRTRELFWNEGNVGVTSSGKSNGLSVRCLLNGSGTSDYFNIYLNVNPTGAGTVTGAGEHQAGSTVSITATANEGWVFVNWTGNISVVDDPNSPETSLTMPYGHIILTANFAEEEPLWPPCPDMPTITDIDGNIYNTVLIGDQCWTRENLKTTKYRNGTSIAYPGTDNNVWENNTTGAYAWYNNDMGWKDIYGALYNWYAVNNTNGLCPAGWSVPTDTEWTSLVNYVVSQGFPNSNVTNGTGNALKSCRQVDSPLGGTCNTTAHPRWDAHDTHHGFDEFGFSAYPGGWRMPVGLFFFIDQIGFHWTATEYSSQSAWIRHMERSTGHVPRLSEQKSNGFSVRCVRDKHSLDLNVNPGDAGTVTGAGEYPIGTEVSIAATANPGWEFVSWTGDTEHIDDENSAYTTVTMPAYSITLTANFQTIGDPCEILNIEMLNISGCNDNGTPNDATDDYYTANVRVTYENSPSTGYLVLEGPFAGSPITITTAVIGGISHTWGSLQFPADGQIVSLTAYFSADAACTFTNPDIYTAPYPCSDYTVFPLPPEPVVVPACTDQAIINLQYQLWVSELLAIGSTTGVNVVVNYDFPVSPPHPNYQDYVLDLRGVTDINDLDLSLTVPSLTGGTVRVKGNVASNSPTFGFDSYFSVTTSVTVSVTFNYNGSPVTYGTVVSAGRCWLDRNLGASRVATSSNDELAYGDLFQWGRGDDGHQERTSGTTTNLSSTDTPGHGDFILAPGSPHDWRSPQNHYLWQGVNGINNPCPPGYRLPTEDEWHIEIQSWCPNSNASGAFDSPLKLTLGGRRYFDGSIGAMGIYGLYWTRIPLGHLSANMQVTETSSWAYLQRFRAEGLSLRCIMDTAAPFSYNLNLNVNPTGAGTVTGLGEHLPGTQVSITATANPGWVFINWTGDTEHIDDKNSATTTATMPAFDIALTANFAEEEPSYPPCPDMPTVTDIDGNVYSTVLIDEQCWMRENLRVTKYNDGADIPNFLEGLEPDGYLYIIHPYVNTYEGHYVVYPHSGGSSEDDVEGITSDQEMVEKYGKLYNWYAAADSRGLCPAGWRVPTDDEWHILEGFADTQYDSGDPVWDSIPRGFDAGKQLKSCRQVDSPLGGHCDTSQHPRWDTQPSWADDAFGVDEFGFSALPGGRGNFRIFNDTLRGFFHHIGQYTVFWTATESCCCSAYDRRMALAGSVVYRLPNPKTRYHSVRCIHGPGPSASYNLDLEVNPASAGTVTGAGEHPAGTQVSIAATANGGWLFVNWTGDIEHVDDVNLASTTLTMPSHNINLVANFALKEPTWQACPDMPTVTDIDGNVYSTVLIGEQCWTRENLRTTYYRNGTPIVYPGNDNSTWGNNTSGAYAWFNNDIGWKDSYGALYNWYAVNNVNGLCPTGWKEPADADWTQLVNFVVSQGYPNTNLTNGAGNALKSCRQVDSPLGEGCNTTAHPRWDSNDTHYGFDEFGFAAFPGSWRYEAGQYSGLGGYGMFWSKTEYDASSAYSRSIYSSAGNISRPFFHSKARGYSIRCVLDPDSPTSYYLQIDVNPSVAGTVTGLGEHLPGTQVSIVATANEGWEFVNWTGDIEHIDDVNSASATVTMPGFDIYLAAHFEPIGLNDVETLAELRTKPPGETIYRYTGEAVIVAMDDFQNRKYIQDASAAIFINDQPGNITTQYALYDVITQVTGQIEIINNMVRFLPSENAPPALGNTPVEPYLLALNEITPNDQAKLTKLFNVTFQDIHAGQVFANGQSYTITDGINSLVVRTHFWDVDYIGETIPGGAVNITGVVTQFHDVMQITPRFAADIENYVEPGAHNLILNVDMAYATNFNPDNDLVYVTGTFAGFWPVPGTDPENQLMTRVDETMIWTKTLFLEEGVYEYKYFLNDGWGGGEWGETINRTIYIDNDTIIHDIWGHFVLELDAQPTAGGTLSGGGIHPFSAIVPVEANPLPGWEFINWTGDIEHVHNANSSGTTVTMPASDVSLTANFAVTGIPENLDLSNETIADGDTECFDALQTITVSDFTVEAGGSVTLIAGESILLLAGTTVEHGGYLLARIAAREDDYCGIPRAMEITKEPVGSKGEDVVPSDFPSAVRENGFFKLYPNPTDGTFTLELTSAELEKTITVEIYSMLGNRLFRKELPAQRLHTISLESQQPGIYIIRVMKGENVGVERLIKR